MSRILFLALLIISLFTLNSVYADSGEWVNNAGPWFVPHLDAGNPAIAEGPTSDIIYLTSREGDQGEWGTFRSLDNAESWSYSDPQLKGREVVSVDVDALYAWAVGPPLDPFTPNNFIKKTITSGVPLNQI